MSDTTKEANLQQPASPPSSPSDHERRANYYRTVLRMIASNDPEDNRQRADALAMGALDHFGEL